MKSKIQLPILLFEYIKIFIPSIFPQVEKNYQGRNKKKCFMHNHISL